MTKGMKLLLSMAAAFFLSASVYSKPASSNVANKKSSGAKALQPATVGKAAPAKQSSAKKKDVIHGLDTLKGTIEHALRQPSKRTEAENKVRAQNEEIIKSRAGFLPQISAQASWELSRANSSAVGGVGSGGATKQTSNMKKVGVGLSQNLFNGFGTIAECDQVKSQIGAAWQEYYAAEQEFLLNVIKSFYTLYYAKKAVELNEINCKAYEQNVADAKVKEMAGAATSSEVADAESYLSSAKANLLVAKSQLVAAVSNYVKETGEMPPENLRLVEDGIKIPKDQKAILDTALKGNKSLLQAKSSLDAGKAAIRVAEAPFLPTVDLQAGVNRVDGFSKGYDGNGGEVPDNSSFGPKNATEFSAGISLKMPLYTGGVRNAKLRQAVLQKKQAEHALLNARGTVVANVESTVSQYFTYLNNIPNYEQSVKSGEIAATNMMKEVEVGTKSRSDALQTQRNLHQARIEKNKADLDGTIAKFTLLQLQGKLTFNTLGIGGGKQFDPRKHYEQVSCLFSGVDNGDDDDDVSTAASSVEVETGSSD